MDSFKIGLLFTAIDRVSGVVQTMQNRVTSNLNKIQDKIRSISESMEQIGVRSMAVGLATTGSLAKSVQMFADLEEAQKRLKTTLMDATGAVGEEYEELLNLANRLGTALPGSTKDMIEMFISLREQGIQTKQILGGVGEATAKFSVLMKLGFSEAATYVAKFQESMGVADKDILQFMDTLQRLKFASGVELEDLSYTFRYMGSSLKALNIQGLENAKKMAAVIGLMAANSIEGSTAGTSFATALGRMAELSDKLNSKKVRELVGLVLDLHGIKLEFFTERGEFIGIEGMIKELEKLKVLGQQERLLVLTKLFGVEAARPLSILVEKGVAGYNEMIQKMETQASMQLKINEIMSGTKMRWDSLSGTFSNFITHLGEAIAEGINLNSVLDRLNNMFGRLDEWVMKNKQLVGSIGAVVVGVGLGLTALGGTMMALGVAARFISVGTGGIVTFIKFTKMAASWTRFLVLGVGVLKNSLIGLSSVLLATPMGRILTGVAIAGLLIYKYWDPISEFFKGFFRGIAEGARGLQPLWEAFKKALPFISSIIKPLELILNLSNKIIESFKGAGFAVGDLGFKLGELLGKILSFPAKLFKAGQALVMSLYEGIKSKIGQPIEAIKELTQRIRNFLPFSPAKEGALRDLNRVNIVGTIAQTIKPEPAIEAMRQAMARVRAEVSPPPGRPARLAGAPATAGVTINISQNFNISGNIDDATMKKLTSQTSVATEQAIWRAIDKYFAAKARREW